MGVDEHSWEANSQHILITLTEMGKDHRETLKLVREISNETSSLRTTNKVLGGALVFIVPLLVGALYLAIELFNGAERTYRGELNDRFTFILQQQASMDETVDYLKSESDRLATGHKEQHANVNHEHPGYISRK